MKSLRPDQVPTLLAEVAAKLKATLGSNGPSDDAYAITAEERSMADNGNKIGAIQSYRARTGVGLKATADLFGWNR